MAQQAKGMGSRLLHQLAGLGNHGHAQDASKASNAAASGSPASPPKGGLFGKGGGISSPLPGSSHPGNQSQISTGAGNTPSMDGYASRFGAQDAQNDTSQMSLTAGDQSYGSNLRAHLPFGDRIGNPLHAAQPQQQQQQQQQQPMPQSDLERQQQAQRFAPSQLQYGQHELPELPSEVHSQTVAAQSTQGFQHQQQGYQGQGQMGMQGLPGQGHQGLSSNLPGQGLPGQGMGHLNASLPSLPQPNAQTGQQEGLPGQGRPSLQSLPGQGAGPNAVAAQGFAEQGQPVLPGQHPQTLPSFQDANQPALPGTGAQTLQGFPGQGPPSFQAGNQPNLQELSTQGQPAQDASALQDQYASYPQYAQAYSQQYAQAYPQQQYVASYGASQTTAMPMQGEPPSQPQPQYAQQAQQAQQAFAQPSAQYSVQHYSQQTNAEQDTRAAAPDTSRSTLGAPQFVQATSPSREEPTGDRTVESIASMRSAYPQPPSTDVTPSKGGGRMDPNEIARVSRVYYVELLHYFRTQTTKISLLTHSRSNAREKLTRLSKQQFAELSTDVHDELKRRQANAEGDQATPYLPGRDDFHPKRNQARQKLATLPKNRFRDLASDVFFELERRFPEFPAELRPEPIEDIMAPKEGDAQRDSTAAENPAAQAPATLNTVPNATQRAQPEQQTSTPQLFVPTRSTAVEESVNLAYTLPSKTDDAPREADPNATDSAVEARAAALQARSADEVQELRGIYEDRIHALERQLEQLQTQLTSSAQAREQAETQLRGTQQVREELEAQVRSAVHVREQLEAQLASTTQEREQLQAQLIRATQEGDQLKSQLTSTTESREQYRSALDEHQLQRQALEAQVRQLEQVLDLHRKQVDELRTAHDARQAELGEKTRALQKANDDLDHRHTDLEALRAEYSLLHVAHANATREASHVDEAAWKREIERMQRDTQQQQQFVQELRTEVASLLEELRRLSARNDAMTTDKESDVAIIRDLHAQMSSYKRQFENAQAELRAHKASTQLWTQPLRSEEWLHVSEQGAIADTNLNSFQTSIDELMATSRGPTPSNVLVAMKTVVLSTSLITDDVAKFESAPEPGAEQLTPQQQSDLQSLKVSTSEALANLMNACRNHASSQGLAPVSLMDAAATHLVMAVVEMIKLVKLRKVERPDAAPTQAEAEAPSSGLKPLHISQRSAIASPPNSASLGLGRTRRAPSQGSLRNLSYNADRSESDRPEALTDDLERPRQPSTGRYSPVRYTASQQRAADKSPLIQSHAAPDTQADTATGIQGEVQNGLRALASQRPDEIPSQTQPSPNLAPPSASTSAGASPVQPSPLLGQGRSPTSPVVGQGQGQGRSPASAAAFPQPSPGQETRAQPSPQVGPASSQASPAWNAYAQPSPALAAYTQPSPQLGVSPQLNPPSQAAEVTSPRQAQSSVSIGQPSPVASAQPNVGLNLSRPSSLAEPSSPLATRPRSMVSPAASSQPTLSPVLPSQSPAAPPSGTSSSDPSGHAGVGSGLAALHGPPAPQGGAREAGLDAPEKPDAATSAAPAAPTPEESSRPTLGQMALGAMGASAAFGALGTSGASGATAAAPAEPRSLAEVPIPEERNPEPTYPEHTDRVSETRVVSGEGAPQHGRGAEAPQGQPVPNADQDAGLSAEPSTAQGLGTSGGPSPDTNRASTALEKQPASNSLLDRRLPELPQERTAPALAPAPLGGLSTGNGALHALSRDPAMVRPEDRSGTEQVDANENWAELRNYIEVQTEAIVHSIQSLLSALREGVQGPQLNENLTQITTIVFSIVAISRDNLPQSTSPQHAPIAAEAERIFAELTDNCDRLSDMQSDTSFDRTTKSVMASASYGVAKGLKALNELLNDADEAALQP